MAAKELIASLLEKMAGGKEEVKKQPQDLHRDVIEPAKRKAKDLLDALMGAGLDSSGKVTVPSEAAKLPSGGTD